MTASVRRAATDPMTPALFCAGGVVAAALGSSDVLAWMSLGGLAGYALSGSV
jgi:hypothetical protein